jgi:hypothetical protein
MIMLAVSDIVRFWHFVADNPRLALTAGGLGLLVAICFFRPIFIDAAGFRESLSPDYHALVKSNWFEFIWAKLKLLFWVALFVGAVILSFYELPRQFPGYLNQRTFQVLVGVQHVFQLSHPPKFLTEELAATDAEATLAEEGLDRNVWQPVADSRTTAPDGRKDQLLTRNSMNPNHGVITYTNSGSAHSRIVSVEFDGSQILCQIAVGK